MKEDLVKVKFRNVVNPNSAFDLVTLEGLLSREYEDHSPENLHKVEFFILILITSGAGYHTIDFTDYKYEKGTILTIRKDQIHKFFKAPKSTGYLLLFKDEFLVSYLEKLEAQKSLQLFNELLGVPKIQLDETEFNTVVDIISRMALEYQRSFDRYSLGIIRSELHILTTKLYRIKTKRNQRLFEKKYLSEFIDFQKLVEAQVSSTTRVRDYADMMAVSTKTLNTISKSIINKTAKEFIDGIAIKQIKRQLINTPLSVKEIALSSGFEETSNFFKYFKNRVGMTPEEFRASF